MSDDAPQPAEHAQSKMGRPTKFSDRLAERILAMAAEGKTDAQIARKLGIGLTTLKNWKGKYGDFRTALAEAKDVADELVEAALFQRAIGYQHPAVKFFCNEGVIVSQKYTEVHAPDVGAAKFWMSNRQPDRWRELTKLEHTGKDGGPIEMTGPQVVITLPSNGREVREAEPAPAIEWLLKQTAGTKFYGKHPSDPAQFELYDDPDGPNVARFPTYASAEQHSRAINLWKVLEVVEHRPGAKA